MTTDEPAELPDSTALLEGLRGLEDADTDEAAAVAVAIGAHLRDTELAAAASAADGSAKGWAGRKWQYADRLDRDRDRGVRIPTGAPTDPWSAAGRADRL